MGERKFPIRRGDAWKNRVAKLLKSEPVRRKRKRMAKVAANPALKVRLTPVWKRVLDLGFCIPALILLAPLFGLIALAIWLQDRRPIFFVSTRVGKDGIPFEFIKFRTMVVGAETLKESLIEKSIHGQGITFKVKGDPRITPVGRILRRLSLDELPQVWNVVRGEMSLVGPRPAVADEVARYNAYDRERLTVLPGLTCIWQVSGRCEVPFGKQVEMDRYYIRNQSIWLDLWLMLRTIPAVVLGKGAY